MNYYPALNQIYMDISNVSVHSYPANVTIIFQFTVTNPTPYVGITFEQITYNAELPNMTGRPFIVSGTAVLNGYLQLPRNATINVPSTSVLTGLGMSQFEQICQQNMNSLSWSIATVLALRTPRDGELTFQNGVGADSTC